MYYSWGFALKTILFPCFKQHGFSSLKIRISEFTFHMHIPADEESDYSFAWDNDREWEDRILNIISHTTIRVFFSAFFYY